jgi:hypothetical protein
MLATGGLLGLLLMGAAVGGLVTGMDAGRDDDDLGEDVDTDTEGETAALEASAYEDVPRIPLADWLAEIGEETAHRGDSGVSNVLYARAVPWDAYNSVDESRVPGIQNTPDGAEIHDASQTHVDALRPEEALPEAMADAAATSSPHLHIVETITFGAGPEIPLVTEFDPHTDRLILDFPGGAGDSPVIGVDLDLSPGDALVLADGVPVTFVAGAATLSPARARHGRVVSQEMRTDRVQHRLRLFLHREMAAVGDLDARHIGRPLPPRAQRVAALRRKPAPPRQSASGAAMRRPAARSASSSARSYECAGPVIIAHRRDPRRIGGLRTVAVQRRGAENGDRSPGMGPARKRPVDIAGSIGKDHPLRQGRGLGEEGPVIGLEAPDRHQAAQKSPVGTTSTIPSRATRSGWSSASR